MKKTMAVVCSLLLTAALCGSAAAQVANEIQKTRAEIQKERQTVVAENLGLTEDEAVAFWPMYRDYRVEMARAGDRLVKLITDYAATWDSVSDEKAGQMMNEYFAIQAEELAIRKRWAPKFKKILSLKKTARFFQIENKLDAAIRYELAGVIPLVK